MVFVEQWGASEVVEVAVDSFVLALLELEGHDLQSDPALFPFRIQPQIAKESQVPL